MDNVLERKQRYGINSQNRLVKANMSEEDKIDIRFNIADLDLICSYILSDSTRIKSPEISNLSRFFALMKMESYYNDYDKMQRINFIHKAIEARNDRGLRHPALIYKYCCGTLVDTPDAFIDLDRRLNDAEIDWVSETVEETIKYAFTYNDMDNIVDVCTRFKSADYRYRGAIVAEFEAVLDSMKAKFRSVQTSAKQEQMFSLQSGTFEDVIYETHKALNNPSVRIKCGMQCLNELTYGGFENGRCYFLFGLPGVGKSVALLNLAYQIKKYNTNYTCKNPELRPAVVFLTMENSVRETVERLFSLSADNGVEMKDCSLDEAIKILRINGELSLSPSSPIDIIIKYVPNGSVDTNYLYKLYDDLEDSGIEMMCLIQDYVKCIRSAKKTSDIRLELGEVTKEFKVFALLKDIPVISASQINRDGAKEFDNAVAQGKSDATKTLGRSNVGESMLMVENIDWGCTIGVEMVGDQKYMSFNRFKIRGKSLPRFYLSHPFMIGNGIKFMEDEGRVPLMKESLASQKVITNLDNFNSGKAKKENPVNNGILENKTNPTAQPNVLDIINLNSNDLYKSNQQKLEERQMREDTYFTDLFREYIDVNENTEIEVIDKVLQRIC